ncbi:unnamed protein product, partial [Adineta steineri]
NSTSSVAVMYMCGACYSLFIDISDTLYCTMYYSHKVISQSLSTRLPIWNTVAGTGTAGSTSLTLYYPRGIFVDTNLNLYVADSVNNRIQKFPSGQLNGTTISTGTIVLNYPTGVNLDADGYLFIVDSYNYRIIGSGPYGYRCIAACTGTYGSTATTLDYPTTLSFDSYGNMYIVDTDNSRIQSFLFLTNSCNGTTTMTNVTSMNSTQSVLLLTSTYATNSTNASSATGLSYNLPQFTPYTTWSSNGITLFSPSTIGTYLYSLFIDTNNTLYVCEYSNNMIQVWLENSNISIRNISGGLSYPYAMFVTANGDVYVDNGNSNSQVDKWAVNTTAGISVMTVKAACWGLFVDIYNNIYCSQYTIHQVVTKSLNGSSNMWIVAAG